MNYRPLIWSSTAFLILASLFMLNKISEPPAVQNSTMTFQGEGKVLAKPDIALVNFSIVTEARTSKLAQDDNSTKSKTVTDFLDDQGIDGRDIKTVSYNIYPQYYYPQYSKPQITGYRVEETIQVKVRDLDKTSSIIDGVIANGANQINSFSFGIDDQEELKDQAREMAIKDAKDKAKSLQKDLGIKLGKIIGFSENTGGYPPIYFAERADLAGVGGLGGGAPEPSLAAGENEIVVNVTVTYQVK